MLNDGITTRIKAELKIKSAYKAVIDRDKYSMHRTWEDMAGIK